MVRNEENNGLRESRSNVGPAIVPTAGGISVVEDDDCAGLPASQLKQCLEDNQAKRDAANAEQSGDE